MDLKRAVNVRSPFFAPRNRRLIVCVVLWGWALFELVTGNYVWAAVTAVAAGWCTYEFFVVFHPDNYKEPDDV